MTWFRPRVTPATFICQHCAVVFPNPRSFRRQKFCSYDCAHASRRIDPAEKRRRQYARLVLYHREVRGQVPMAEYRARIAAEKLARVARLAEDCAQRRSIRLAEVERQKAETRARFLAKAADRAAAGKAWREANRERHRASIKAWKRANPEKQRNDKAGSRRRKAERLMKLQSGRCAYCRGSITVANSHVDHIVPLALGGPNRRANLQLLCVPCNLSKGAKHPVEFARSLGRLL